MVFISSFTLSLSLSIGLHRTFLPASLPTSHMAHTLADATAPPIHSVHAGDKSTCDAACPPAPPPSIKRRWCRRCRRRRTVSASSNASNCWGPCAIHRERCQVPAAAYLTWCRPSTGRPQWWSRWTRRAARGCSKWPPPPWRCYSYCALRRGRLLLLVAVVVFRWRWGMCVLWFVDTRVFHTKIWGGKFRAADKSLERNVFGGLATTRFSGFMWWLKSR